ncbi:helix-turn-helix domain-containing protein [Spirillospora sp. NPDC048911]|uniref:helix-turn-helix domain-containing protein n=1 Tax=Spirillospora sp. NPDC048911 TaxID=3364527 RepID=UPI003721A947
MNRRQRARRGEGRNPQKPQNGFAIREFRQIRRWSGTALAREIGISHSTLSNIEAERRPASDEVLNAIAFALDIDVRAIRRDKVGVASETPLGVSGAVAC